MSVGSLRTNQEGILRASHLRVILFAANYNSRFPFVLPFSQMYPLCCIDIRNFLNQFYFFSDDHFQHPNVIDETLKKVEKLLICHLVLILITTSAVSRSAAFPEGLQISG
jgi:hypothetical protein